VKAKSEVDVTPISEVSRRDFLAASGAVVAAGAIATESTFAKSAAPDGKSQLAIDGGPKTVKEVVVPAKRWGEPERERLNAAIEQNTMFYWQGPQTALFTERFREVCPVKYVMTCSSGTAALHIAVAAAGIGPGDEVITTGITDVGTVIGVLYQQGVPVFADLVPNTYNLDPADVERKITPKTKAIIAVHLAGNPCRMEELKSIADKHKLVLIEDCAQAWGAKYRGKPVGTIGHIACFSLQQTKQITAGDGGVVGSSDERFGPLLQRYGDKGANRTHPGLQTIFATNYRMTELQAGFAAAQLTRLEKIVSKRSKLGNMLGDKIAGAPGVEPHGIDPDDRATYWFYMFCIDPKTINCNRAQFVKALVAEGVPASAGYIQVPLYGNPVFQKHEFFAGRWPVKEMGLTSMDYSKVSLAETKKILDNGVRMVFHEGMTESFMSSVGDAIRKVAEHYA
jgi:dTDP-4-amino-4,6-dideoxygalactose transaminase